MCERKWRKKENDLQEKKEKERLSAQKKNTRETNRLIRNKKIK